jgi:hypothetical protein
VCRWVHLFLQVRRQQVLETGRLALELDTSTGVVWLSGLCVRLTSKSSPLRFYPTPNGKEIPIYYMSQGQCDLGRNNETIMRIFLILLTFCGLTRPALADDLEWYYSDEVKAAFYGTPETDDVLVRMACGERKGEITLEFPYYATKPYSREEIYDLADRWNQVSLGLSKKHEEMPIAGDATPYMEDDEPAGWQWSNTFEGNHPIFDFISTGGTIQAEGYETKFSFPAKAGAVLKSLRRACR